jgi:hypothetical protein
VLKQCLKDTMGRNGAQWEGKKNERRNSVNRSRESTQRSSSISVAQWWSIVRPVRPERQIFTFHARESTVVLETATGEDRWTDGNTTTRHPEATLVLRLFTETKSVYWKTPNGGSCKLVETWADIINGQSWSAQNIWKSFKHVYPVCIMCHSLQELKSGLTGIWKCNAALKK